MGNSLNMIERYFHKVILNFLSETFNSDQKIAKDSSYSNMGILKDISDWLK